MFLYFETWDNVFKLVAIKNDILTPNVSTGILPKKYNLRYDFAYSKFGE